eukprot:3245882-Amphidinium_carterae.1
MGLAEWVRATLEKDRSSGWAELQVVPRLLGWCSLPCAYRDFLRFGASGKTVAAVKNRAAATKDQRELGSKG